MISKASNSLTDPCVKTPPTWWRLPFSTALAFQGLVSRQCQLCHSRLCAPLAITNVLKGCNDHWFNRLQYICDDCHASTIWCNSRFTLDISALSNSDATAIEGLASTFYTYPYDAVMLRYKNGQHLEALMPLIHAVRQLSKPVGSHHDNSVIIPVPTSPQRLKQRGFAPVWLLAQFLSFHWQIPLFTGVQRDERQHQQGLNREQRLENIKDAFYFNELPAAKNLIFFDDVVTTGATLKEIIETAINKNQFVYRVSSAALLHGH